MESDTSQNLLNKIEKTSFGPQSVALILRN
jgi:hypothetical protein